MALFDDDLLSTFLLPPMNLIILGGVGLILFRSKPRVARALTFITLALLYVFSTSAIVDFALRRFEFLHSQAVFKQADAIVVLGGGENTLERLRSAALLQKDTGKPILVSGGGPLTQAGSETEAMQSILIKDFNVPVKWVEASSKTTYDNAINSARLLRGKNIHTIFLVTDAWHMPRASFAFRKAGLEVVEVPVSGRWNTTPSMLSLLPNAESLLKSKLLIHELIGLFWYRIK